jgi:flagellar biosynthesis protein FliR
VIAIAWHVAMGLVARIVSRMQIYFVSMPGQIALGLALLIVTASLE